jgi:hypothetical protein
MHEILVVVCTRRVAKPKTRTILTKKIVYFSYIKLINNTFSSVFLAMGTGPSEGERGRPTWTEGEAPFLEKRTVAVFSSSKKNTVQTKDSPSH